MTLVEIQKEILRTVTDVQSEENPLVCADKIGYIKGLVWALSGKQQDSTAPTFSIMEWMNWSRIPCQEVDGKLEIDPDWKEKHLKN